MVEIETPYLSGRFEAVCMKSPLYDVIVGNVPGVYESVNVEGASMIEEETSEIKEAQAVVTRAQAKKDYTVKLLNVTDGIDCEVTAEEIQSCRRRMIVYVSVGKKQRKEIQRIVKKLK